MPQSERLLDGQIFARYRIVRMLGQGGMGAVYEAVHLGLKKRFAIKTLLPSLAQSPEAQARFLREGEAASRMNHPNVVDVTDVGTEGGVPYLVMEYLEGETLGDFSARKGPLDVAVGVDLLLPAISAVAAGHDEGVIHRDLKPQNIFLARSAWGEPIPKILDFGVSKLLGGDNPALTGTMAVLGTASYMSPEQARGARVVDAKSDQYAMGLIFYEMLTAQRVHNGDHPLEVLHKIASGVVASPLGTRPDLPQKLEATLMRMLASDPEERHVSMRAVGRALLPFATDKVRMNFGQAFGGDGTEGVAPAFASTAGTLILPGSTSTSKAGGTELLPNPGFKNATTLGQSAIEDSRRPQGGRRGWKILAGGVLLTAAVVVVVVPRGQRQTNVRPALPTSNSQPTTSVPEATPATSGPELLHSAGGTPSADPAARPPIASPRTVTEKDRKDDGRKPAAPGDGVSRAGQPTARHHPPRAAKKPPAAEGGKATPTPVGANHAPILE